MRILARHECITQKTTENGPSHRLGNARERLQGLQGLHAVECFVCSDGAFTSPTRGQLSMEKGWPGGESGSFARRSVISRCRHRFLMGIGSGDLRLSLNHPVRRRTIGGHRNEEDLAKRRQFPCLSQSRRQKVSRPPADQSVVLRGVEWQRPLVPEITETINHHALQGHCRSICS